VVLPLREGTQAVAVLSPAGELLREVGVPGAAPGRLCLGGPNSRTVYVKEVTKQQPVQFRADRPGLADWLDRGGPPGHDVRPGQSEVREAGSAHAAGPARMRRKGPG
jgi:hypothetical protein